MYIHVCHTYSSITKLNISENSKECLKKKIKSIRKWIFDLLQSKDFYIYRKIVDMNYEKIKLFET